MGLKSIITQKLMFATEKALAFRAVFYVCSWSRAIQRETETGDEHNEAEAYDKICDRICTTWDDGQCKP